MIRAFQDSDLDVVMSIWLSANIGAHNFIDPEYWKRNFDRSEERRVGKEC